MAKKFFSSTIWSAASLGASGHSSTQEIPNLTVGCIQAVWTGGAPVGNFTIETSNDTVTWDTYPNSTHAAGGDVGSWSWNIEDMGFPYIRLAYTRTSDTGTVTAKFTGKRVGL